MATRTALGALAAFAFMVGVSGQAEAQTSFGSRLTATTQPANAGKGVFCKENNRGQICSAVMTIARNRPNSAVLAPKDGTLAKVRLIACFPGSFVLQLVQMNDAGEATDIRTGPTINYVGDRRHCRRSRFDIEEFPVNLPIRTGDRMAVLATKIGFVYSAGDNGSQLFAPPLADGEIGRTSFDQGTGIILLEGIYDD
jgi:hypothetical protein